MAIADTAESAVADDEHFASLAMFMKVSALAGDRGFNFEYANGALKVSVFPASKVNSPPDKGSWRRAGVAPATTKPPYKQPRAAKHEAAGAKPALPSATLHSPDCQSKEQHQPGAADATGNSRQKRRARRAANPAAAAPAASLYTAAAAEQALRRGRRPACGWAARGCGAATWSRRVLHKAEGGLRGGCPELEARGGRPAPFLRAARPGLAGAPEPARRPRADPLPAHALSPGGPVGAPDPRVSVRARLPHGHARASCRVEGPHLNGTEPQHLAKVSAPHSPRTRNNHTWKL
eukprot:scaffold7582_cov72-Phaeocystis_antarctica.AAC.2